jgi:hypothetical protein
MVLNVDTDGAVGDPPAHWAVDAMVETEAWNAQQKRALGGFRRRYPQCAW